MERLFRQRMEYLGAPLADECFLCTAAKSKDPDADLVLKAEPLACAVLNKFPYNSGHLVVAPTRHIPSLQDLTGEETLAVMRLVSLSIGVLQKEFQAEGFNFGANLGDVAGAGVPGHLHLHLVPRWAGDTNFMPVLAGAKVIPEPLGETYLRLKKAFDAT